MVYCAKCGQQNPDGAQFCSSCGASLVPPKKEVGKEWEQKCEDECARGPRAGSIFWALIIILVGLWILFELGLKNIKGLPDWLTGFEFWWIFPVLIGLVIIVLGIRLLIRRR